MNKKEIYLAGGCFWGTEHFVGLLPGVLETSVGYANGSSEKPTYEEVCSGETGHAETVRVVYDETIIRLDEILDMFYRTIDPTSLNKQGGDIGTQYRTGIYYAHAEDEEVIRTSLSKLQERYTLPLVVECEPIRAYWTAEDYHQKYLHKNPSGYCHIGQDLFILARAFAEKAKSR